MPAIVRSRVAGGMSTVPWARGAAPALLMSPVDVETVVSHGGLPQFSWSWERAFSAQVGLAADPREDVVVVVPVPEAAKHFRLASANVLTLHPA